MTLAAVAIGLTAVSGLVSAMGAANAAEAQAEQFEYERAVSERNEVIARQDRLQTIRTSQIEAEDKRRENLRILASSRAAYGASGVELSGSPLEALADSSFEMALDVRRIEYEGQVRAREGAVRILGLEDEQNIATSSASNARSAGRVASATAILNAGTSIAKIGAAG